MRRHLTALILAMIVITIPAPLHAQTIQPRRLVTSPTAGTLPHGSYALETHLFDGGGVTQRFAVGIADLLEVGLSYSGANIVGSRHVTWQPHVGAQFRVRIIEESMSAPGIALGFDSQGDGQYIGELRRFRQKSKGVYVVVSRNYRLFGNLGIHGGMNYSFEDDDDRDPSFWAGIDKDVFTNLELVCEYDFATNDNDDRAMTANRGYLNAAVKLNLSRAFILEFDVRNILRNEKSDLNTSTDNQQHLDYYIPSAKKLAADRR